MYSVLNKNMLKLGSVRFNQSQSSTLGKPTNGSLVPKFFLSETIHAQENGSRGPHFAKSLNSNFLKGLTYSAVWYHHWYTGTEKNLRYWASTWFTGLVDWYWKAVLARSKSIGNSFTPWNSWKEQRYYTKLVVAISAPTVVNVVITLWQSVWNSVRFDISLFNWWTMSWVIKKLSWVILSTLWDWIWPFMMTTCKYA